MTRDWRAAPVWKAGARFVIYIPNHLKSGRVARLYPLGSYAFRDVPIDLDSGEPLHDDERGKYEPLLAALTPAIDAESAYVWTFIQRADDPHDSAPRILRHLVSSGRISLDELARAIDEADRVPDDNAKGES